MASRKCTIRTHHCDQLQYSPWWTHPNMQRQNGGRQCSNLFQKGSAHSPSRIALLLATQWRRWVCPRMHTCHPLTYKASSRTSHWWKQSISVWKNFTTQTLKSQHYQKNLSGSWSTRLRRELNSVSMIPCTAKKMQWRWDPRLAWSHTSQYLCRSLWEETGPWGTGQPTDVPPVRWRYLLNHPNGWVKQ